MIKEYFNWKQSRSIGAKFFKKFSMIRRGVTRKISFAGLVALALIAES